MKHTRTLTQKIRIILVEPEGDGNIGSVCRAMKTMGITELYIVSRRVPDYVKVKTMALHAMNVYEGSQQVETLEQALDGSVFSAGITRRRGKFRKYVSLLPEELAQKAASFKTGSISLVFGRETNGLTADELALCAAAVHIPSSPDFPSLNLSHAVQIITYSLFRHSANTHQYEAIGQEKINKLSQTIVASYDRIGFFKTDKREIDDVGRFFRDILVRAALSPGEANRLEKMFLKMAAIKIHKNPHHG